MFSIKHLVCRPFNALHRSMAGYRPFSFTPDSDLKVVETSRYTHATDANTGARVYMSKPSSILTGTILVTGEVTRGATFVPVTVYENGKVAFKGTVSVRDGKAMAATLNSACMKADPKTGEKMDRTEWQSLDRTADHARSEAAYTASLFQ